MSDHQAGQGYRTVNVYRAPGAVKIELNRPERMNAWSGGLSADLLKALREVAADDEVRAVMLTGAGRAFCSGADLKEGLAAARDTGGPIDTEATLVTWYNPIVTALEAKIQGELGGSRDFLEGVTAFVEKRKAAFTGE